VDALTDAEGTSVDPVCGMTVDIAEAKRHELFYVYDYREYAFCARGCLAAFLKDPQRYVAAGGRDAP